VGGVPLQGAGDRWGQAGHEVSLGLVAVLVGAVAQLVLLALVVGPLHLALDGLPGVVGAQLLLDALLAARDAVTGLEAVKKEMDFNDTDTMLSH